MSKISYSIMATHSRESMVQRLKSILGDIPVSYDDGSGIWANRVKAMLIADQTADFICVLQDDAWPCKDFYNEVEKLVKEDKCYSLYLGNRHGGNFQDIVGEAYKKGFLEKNECHWGVAIVLPTRIIPDLIKYWEKKRTYTNQDDTRISYYLQHIKMKVYYPLPSLVEHRDNGISAMNNSGRGRVAYKFKDNI